MNDMGKIIAAMNMTLDGLQGMIERLTRKSKWEWTQESRTYFIRYADDRTERGNTKG